MISCLNFLFAELGFPHKEDAVHPINCIVIHVHHYETLDGGMVENLPLGFYRVAVDNGYIIGIIFHGHLWPFMAPGADLKNNYERVKFLINGNNADEIVPILSDDPLNLLFFKRFRADRIRSAEISVPLEFNSRV